VDLLLVRHGITQLNADRVFMGHGPVPLSATGRQQVARLAERLAASPPDRVIASDIVRAVESAEIITKRLGMKFDRHPELREIDVGEAVGASYAEAAERWPDVFLPEGEGRFPGGESFSEVADRTSAFLRDDVVPRGGRVLVVTHGGVVRGVAARLLGLPLAAVAAFVIDNASLTIFRVAPGAVQMLTWNDTAHLGPAGAGGQWPTSVGG